MSRLPLTSVLIAMLLVSGCDREAAGDSQQQAELGAPKEGLGDKALTGLIDVGFAGELMPAVALTDPAGAALNTGALQGQPVLVNLWATWCAPCIAEMPQLDELAADYEGRMRVLTVSQDLQGAERVEPFFAQRSFEHLEPWLDPDTRLGFALGNVVLPTTVLYDENGLEIWRIVGGYDWGSEEARAAIDEALEG